MSNVAAKKKRIMRRFRLTEISAVDSPAQKGAQMTIMKRDEGTNQFDKLERSPPMERTKQAGQFAYDDEDFNSLVFEEDRAPSKSLADIKREERKELDKRRRDLATGDFHHLVEALKRMEPGLSGTDAMSKARRLAPGAFAKMNGGRKQVSYGSCEEALEALAKTEFDAAVELARLNGKSRTEAMTQARLDCPEAYAELNGTEAVTKGTASGAKRQWDLEVAAEECDGCSKEEAARRAARKRPDLRYSKGITPGTNDLAGMRGSDPTMADGTAKRDWMFAVAKIQDRDRCTYTEAMSKARKEYPAEFAAFQGIGGQQTEGSAVYVSDPNEDEDEVES